MKMTAALILSSFLAGLFAYAPADKTLALLGADRNLSLSHVEGRALAGRIENLRVGHVQLDELHWRIRWPALLGLQMHADVESHLAATKPDRATGKLHGQIRHGLFSESIRLLDLRGEASLSSLQPLLQLKYLPLDADLALNFSQIVLQDQRVLLAQGEVQVNQASWTLGRPVEIGNYLARIETEKEIIQVKMNDADDASVSLDLGASLDPDQSYRYSVALRPKLDTPASLVNQLKGLGRTDQQGWYRLEGSGKL